MNEIKTSTLLAQLIEIAKEIVYSKEKVKLIWGSGTREYFKCKSKLEELKLLNNMKKQKPV